MRFGCRIRAPTSVVYFCAALHPFFAQWRQFRGRAGWRLAFCWQAWTQTPCSIANLSSGHPLGTAQEPLLRQRSRNLASIAPYAQGRSLRKEILTSTLSFMSENLHAGRQHLYVTNSSFRVFISSVQTYTIYPSRSTSTSLQRVQSYLRISRWFETTRRHAALEQPSLGVQCLRVLSSNGYIESQRQQHAWSTSLCF